MPKDHVARGYFGERSLLRAMKSGGPAVPEARLIGLGKGPLTPDDSMGYCSSPANGPFLGEKQGPILLLCGLQER